MGPPKQRWLEGAAQGKGVTLAEATCSAWRQGPDGCGSESAPRLPCFPTQEEGPLRLPRLSREGWLGADSPCEAASCLGGKHGLSGQVAGEGGSVYMLG